MKAQELAAMPAAELRQRATKLREEIFESRFKTQTEATADVASLRAKRKEIAVIHTVLRQQELGGKPGTGKLAREERKRANVTKANLAEKARRSGARKASANGAKG